MVDIVPWHPPYVRTGAGGRRRNRRQPVLGATPTPPPEPRLEIIVRATSFMSDVRSAYDGAIGGTSASAFVAIPGLGAVPNRVFWISQSDGTTQRGLNPINWFPSLAGYVDVQISAPTGMVSDVALATLLAAGIAAFGDYTVSQIGNTVIVDGQIDSFAAFLGPSFSTRGPAGLWGIRVAQVNTLPFGTSEAPVTAAICNHATSPANPVNRIKAFDVFIGSIHNVGDQYRCALYEGGTALNPDGALLRYDFGQLSGTGINQWVRVWVPSNTVVTVGSATNLWLWIKGAVGTTVVRNVSIGVGWSGNMTDQTLRVNFGIAAAAGTAWPAAIPAGSVPVAANIICMRVIYDTSPYAGDGSWMRRFGVHLASIAGVGVQAPLNGQMFMGATPPQALDMELDYTDVPYGTTHTGQYRGGSWNDGVLYDPSGAPILYDFGQTAGAVTDAYVRINAPGPGPSAIAVLPTDPLWWGVKDRGSGSTFRLANGANPEIASPPENPMDWAAPSQWFIADPPADSDPSSPYEAVVPAGGVAPGNFPFGALGLRINPIELVPS